MEFLTRFSKRKRSQLVIPDDPKERRTKSEFLKDCDINLIMAKYKKTGILPSSARSAAARYGDFSQVPTFAEMQDKINAAQEVFAALPAKVRKQFDNDPSQFLQAAETAEGRELMKQLGLGRSVDTESPKQPEEVPPSTKSSSSKASAKKGTPEGGPQEVS